MRVKNILALFVLLVPLLSRAATVDFYFTNFNATITTNTPFQVFPVSLNTNGTYVVVGLPIRIPALNGVATNREFLPGSYELRFITEKNQNLLTATFLFNVPANSSNYNVVALRTASVSQGGGTAYTQAQSDALFALKTELTNGINAASNNIINKLSANGITNGFSIITTNIAGNTNFLGVSVVGSNILLTLTWTNSAGDGTALTNMVLLWGTNGSNYTATLGTNFTNSIISQNLTNASLLTNVNARVGTNQFETNATAVQGQITNIINDARTWHVQTNGVDATAIKGKPQFPARTFGYVSSNSVSGDFIYIHTGTHFKTNRTELTNVTIYLEPGSVLIQTNDTEAMFGLDVGASPVTNIICGAGTLVHDSDLQPTFDYEQVGCKLVIDGVNVDSLGKGGLFQIDSGYLYARANEYFQSREYDLIYGTPLFSHISAPYIFVADTLVEHTVANAGSSFSLVEAGKIVIGSYPGGFGGESGAMNTNSFVRCNQLWLTNASSIGLAQFHGPGTIEADDIYIASVITNSPFVEGMTIKGARIHVASGGILYLNGGLENTDPPSIDRKPIFIDCQWDTAVTYIGATLINCTVGTNLSNSGRAIFGGSVTMGNQGFTIGSSHSLPGNIAGGFYTNKFVIRPDGSFDWAEGDGTLTANGGGAFSADVIVPDEAYGSGWNGSLEVPTKNALYDKIETLGGGSTNGLINTNGTIQLISTNWTIETPQTNGFSLSGNGPSIYTLGANSYIQLNKFDSNIYYNASGSNEFLTPVHFDSTFNIQANKGNGKVLTSDANGFGTWQSISGSSANLTNSSVTTTNGGFTDTTAASGAGDQVALFNGVGKIIRSSIVATDLVTHIPMVVTNNVTNTTTSPVGLSLELGLILENDSTYSVVLNLFFEGDAAGLSLVMSYDDANADLTALNFQFANTSGLGLNRIDYEDNVAHTLATADVDTFVRITGTIKTSEGVFLFPQFARNSGITGTQIVLKAGSTAVATKLQ